MMDNRHLYSHEGEVCVTVGGTRTKEKGNSHQQRRARARIPCEVAPPTFHI